MTGTVFAVASGKGGVGKTTTAINLGAMLAAANHEVIVVDTDLGMANVSGYLDFDIDGSTLHEVLSGEADVEDAIYPAPGGIDVLPSSTDIHAFAQSQTAQLQEVVADLTNDYEYVLLDTGAGISYDTILPLSLADDVLLVTTPDVAAVRDTAKTAELTARVDGTVRGAVLTQRGNDILNADNVEGTLDTEVLTVVPDDETVPMGIDAGRPLAVFAPNSPPAKAYRELASILTGETETPELSGEPSKATANSPSLADAEFELGTTSPENSPDTEEARETNPEPAKTSDPTVEADSNPTESAAGSQAATDSATPEPPSDAPESDADPVHDLIDRRVIKTGDDAEGSEPTVEAAPLEAETKTETPPVDDTNDSDVDDSQAEESDTEATHIESAEDEMDEFDTALSDDVETSAEPTDDTHSPSDLPDEIVEAESNDGMEAVPFQDEPVRPELDGDGDDDDDAEKNGLFGRIGSLFR